MSIIIIFRKNSRISFMLRHIPSPYLLPASSHHVVLRNQIPGFWDHQMIETDRNHDFFNYYHKSELSVTQSGTQLLREGGSATFKNSRLNRPSTFSSRGLLKKRVDLQ